MVIVQFRGRLVRQYRACVVDSLDHISEVSINATSSKKKHHVIGSLDYSCTGKCTCM